MNQFQATRRATLHKSATCLALTLLCGFSLNSGAQTTNTAANWPKKPGAGGTLGTMLGINSAPQA